jgi:hypothetical protein
MAMSVQGRPLPIEELEKRALDPDEIAIFEGGRGGNAPRRSLREVLRALLRREG